MPNHFLTVGLCGRDWYGDPNEVSLEPLNGANLCELISPLPPELAGITSPGNQRYINKATGEVHKNDELFPDASTWERVSLSDHELCELCDRFGATNWHEWQNKNWGTKWGVYGLKVHEMGGDGSPILIEFQTAWGPPSPEMMGRINGYLRDTYGLINILWIGHDPYDDSTLAIEVGAIPDQICDAVKAAIQE